MRSNENTPFTQSSSQVLSRRNTFTPIAICIITPSSMSSLFCGAERRFVGVPGKRVFIHRVLSYILAR